MKEQSKSRPRRLDSNIKREIYKRAIEDRSIPRDLLARRLIREFKKDGYLPPTIDTAKKYISKARKTYDPLDKPWTLSSCREYPTFFPTPSLHYLLEMRYFEDKGMQTKARSFSIRQAIWIVRLQHLLNKYFSFQSFEDEYRMMSLISDAYSTAEKTSEIMNEETFDTSDLDNSLYNGTLYKICKSGFDHRKQLLKNHTLKQTPLHGDLKGA